ncbi:hypothetical protein FGG08_006720 [Glutinoglossum americanum]|uniref:HNH nuclease domain-containing protein n=1 Tax=Glutinoglossum americanum TaxID=1670608 RepID=A0A9P8I6T7_9PEZI|nr:hypothetical protein FGG08_006720 [Glutinoglossum americanum]
MTSSACVSDSVRARIRKTFGSCWLCSTEDDGDIAHVFPKAEEKMFCKYQELGIINAHGINKVENLILLCPSCHRYFDKIFPGWIFLPADLDEMIHLEEQFHAYRTCEASAGRLAIRKPPPIQARLYVRYVLRPELFPWSLALFDEEPTALWGGDPASTILRNAGAPLLPHGNEKLTAILPKFTRLLELYRVPPPPIVPRSGPGGDGDNPGKQGGDQEEQEIQTLGNSLAESPRKRAASGSYNNGMASPALKDPRTSSPGTSGEAGPKSRSYRANHHRLSRKLIRSSPYQNSNHLPPDSGDQWIFGPERTSAELSEAWNQYEDVRRDAEARAKRRRRR